MERKSHTVRNLILVLFAAIVFTAGNFALYYFNGDGYTFKYVAVNMPAKEQQLVGYNEHITKAFRNMLRRAELSSADKAQGKPTFYLITHSGSDAEHKYNIYFNDLISRSVYIEDTVSNQFLKAKEADVVAFFTLDGMGDFIYHYTNVPSLTLQVGGTEYVAEPISSTWKYITISGMYKSGVFTEGSAVSVSCSEAILPVFSAQFDPQINVNVQCGDEILFSGNAADMPEIARNAEKDIVISVKATWATDKTKEYYGDANYMFVIPAETSENIE